MEESRRNLVICGDLLGEGKASHGAYEESGKVYSRFVGLAEEKNGMHFVIPLSGIYNPKRGDGIIGRIEDIIFSKWLIDINSPYQAALSLNEAVDEFIDLTKTDLTNYFSYGDLIFAEIMSVTKTKNIQLSMRDRKCRKLKGGRLIKVTPSKVPRIIGRSGSMVEMIKQVTGTQIVVGQNGLVWIKGDNEDIATEAILVIEERSHTHGLTDYVKSLLEKRMKESGLPITSSVRRGDEVQWGETNE
ncbi:MAG: exosome complex RNA-binding protein Rrp4 [Candidatus Aenigmarchaeota archaeon]|nr:exosome complex RNA-binding protein Rrp4 [Candidatus Aenigmarchaeota archaeon]MDI6722609.1 exosome complex RNA-binding protein Rrp4 [Candidatus Aenigmarchaeota archaeon]